MWVKRRGQRIPGKGLEEPVKGLEVGSMRLAEVRIQSIRRVVGPDLEIWKRRAVLKILYTGAIRDKEARESDHVSVNVKIPGVPCDC